MRNTAGWSFEPSFHHPVHGRCNHPHASGKYCFGYPHCEKYAWQKSSQPDLSLRCCNRGTGSLQKCHRFDWWPLPWFGKSGCHTWAKKNSGILEKWLGASSVPTSAPLAFSRHKLQQTLWLSAKRTTYCTFEFPRAKLQEKAKWKSPMKNLKSSKTKPQFWSSTCRFLPCMACHGRHVIHKLLPLCTPSKRSKGYSLAKNLGQGTKMWSTTRWAICRRSDCWKLAVLSINPVCLSLCMSNIQRQNTPTS